MEAVHFTKDQLNERFAINGKYQRIILIVAIVGLVLTLIGAFTASTGGHGPVDHGHDGHGHGAVIEQGSIHSVSDTHGAGSHSNRTVTIGTRVWANFLLNNIYFLTLAMGAMFFLAIHSVGKGGWHMAIRRIPEAMTTYMPVAFIGLAVIMFFGMGSLYDWMHPEGDALVMEKTAYLNQPFFIIRNLIFFAGWGFFMWRLRQMSKKEDEIGGDAILDKMKITSALFVIFFAISYTLFAVDWIKSLEPHWFSTIFGVYIFAGTMVSSITVMMLIFIFLKSQGYMQYANDSHKHDLGKYMFGFSVFWAYIWVAQYLLIWYSNIPEETFYYAARMRRADDMYYLGDPFYMIWYINLFINFIFPFLIFMTRNAKRTNRIIIPMASVMLIGHWLDLYQLIMPGAVNVHWNIGLLEVGMFMMFAGIFAYWVLNALTKANLVALNSPYLEESIHHSTGPV